MSAILSPSLLSSDLNNIENAVKYIESNNGDAIHIDVMDGHFVPEITYGEPIIRSVRKITTLPLDIHLMIENAEQSIDDFIDSGSDWITFHIESVRHANRLATYIKSCGKKAGVALNPATPVCMIEELLSVIDIVLIMSVNPGFAGQKFIPSVLHKIEQIRNICNSRGYKKSPLISIDGGINSDTLKLAQGCDIIVSGSAYFSGRLGWEK